MTPFEKAGYTKDTKFKVLTKDGDLEVGDIVTLNRDWGDSCPIFVTECGRKGVMYVPGLEGLNPVDLKVFEDHTVTLQQRVTELEKVIEQLKEKGIV